MKKQMRKITSMLTALSLCAGFAGQAVPQYTEHICAESASEQTEMSEELISVIIKINGNAFLADESNSLADLESEEAETEISKIEQAQKKVQDKIRKLYPDLETGYSYSLLINGFSCCIPENIINEVRRIPEVKSVIRSRKRKAPDMTFAGSVAGINAFSEYSGCTGEGTVIAVIDTELDISHDMFSAIDDKNNRITKATIDNIINSGRGFNKQFTSDEVYISSKLPFVFDYAGNDLYDPDVYHGTHVSGIAAGNRIETDNGPASGAAPDAQLVFMGIADEYGYIDEEAVIAAFEDAVLLEADVINISFGDIGETFCLDDPLIEAAAAAEKAGVIVCQSAGNQGRNFNSASDPDTATTSASLGYSGIFSVAACDNASIERGNSAEISFNGAKIEFGESYQYNEAYDYIEAAPIRSRGSFEAVETDISQLGTVDLKDKIALMYIDNDDLIRDNLDELAATGAALFIVCRRSCDFEDDIPGISLECESPVDLAVIGKRAMEFILSSDDKKIIEIKDEERPDGKLADYSSFGVSSDLRLEPDITGVGTSVFSAGYDNSFVENTGTSMASPYVAGCVALACEYFNKNGLSAEQKPAFIRNILMNTAVPDFNGDIPVSPRRQGAGIVNMSNVPGAHIVVTGNEGDAKINLYDHIEDDFSFSINVSNFTDEPVEYKNAELILLTDDCTFMPDYGDFMINGSQLLSCSADLSELKTIPADSNRDITVNVSLDHDQLEKIGERFINGFFIEGYLILSDSGNSSDVSVPLLGYHGDWDYKTLMECNKAALFTETFSSVYEKIKKRMDAGETSEEILYDLSADFSYDGPFYLSNDYNGVRDQISASVTFSDGCFKTVTLTDRISGVQTDITTEELEEIESYFDLDPTMFSDQEDGEYTYELKAFTAFKDSMENPESVVIDLVKDTRSPEFKNEYSYDEDGIISELKINVSDPNLDSVVILGKKKTDTSCDPAEIIGMIGSRLDITDNLFTGMYNNDFERMLNDQYKLPTVYSYNYIEVIPASGDTLSFEYDMSEFEYCNFFGVDKAFNTSEDLFFKDIRGSIGTITMRPGIWRTDDDRFVTVNSDGMSGTFFSPFNSSELSFNISFTDDPEYFNYSDEINKNGAMNLTGREKAIIYNYESDSADEVNLYYLSSESRDELFYYNDEQMQEIIRNYFDIMIDGELISLEKTKDGMLTEYNLKGSDEYGKLELDFEFDIVEGTAYVYWSEDYVEQEIMYRFDHDILRGDTDRNGNVNAADVYFMVRAIMGDYYDAGKMFTDLNYDSEVNVADLIELKNILLNIY